MEEVGEVNSVFELMIYVVDYFIKYFFLFVSIIVNLEYGFFDINYC